MPRYQRQTVSGNHLWKLEGVAPRQERRSSINTKEVRDFWAPILCEAPWRKFDSAEEIYQSDFCFACGWEHKGKLQAAHIVPHANGCRDHPSNTHLLCIGCHAISEWRGGIAYWRWFRWWRGTVSNRFWNGDVEIMAEVERLFANC